MKKKLLSKVKTLLTFLFLLFTYVQGWAAGTLSATTITLPKGATQTITYTDTNVDGNSSATVLYLDELSKSLITVEANGEWNSDPATIKVTANATQTGTAKFQVKFTNPNWNHGGYSCTTEIITVNVVDNTGGNTGGNTEGNTGGNTEGNTGSTDTPSGGSTSGNTFTGDKKGGYTAEELKAQYNPIDMEKVKLIISKKRQITHLPTIYITIPDATSATTQAELNAIVFKNISTGEALYHSASIKVVDDNNESLSFEDDALEIKVRGNETAQGSKKPYRLKFGKDEKDEAGNVTVSHKHDMLGYGYEKRNWTLIANQKDGSFCHNALSYHIGKAVGMEFCPGYRFVDLVINDIYLGCYMVSDHIEVGSNRIKLENEDTGWYVESNRDNQVEAPYLEPTEGGGIYISIKNPDYKTTDPDYAAKVAALKNDVSTYFTKAKAVIDKYATDINLFRDHENGWRKYFDEESLVKYYVGENLTGNHDGYMTVKMYRDMGQKIKVGPMWDHDTAFGIYDEGGKTLCEDAQVQAALFCGKYAKIIADNDPEFMQKANYLLQKVLADGYADNMKKHIADITSSVATSRTIESPYASAFQTEIDKLESYITDHTTWLQETVDAKAESKTIVFPETSVTPPVPTRAQLTNLPTIYLNAETIDGSWKQAAIEVFDKDNKLKQGVTWTKVGVTTDGDPAIAVQFQGSGSMTSGKKESYRLKFGKKITLLTSDKYKQWVLVANDDDPSMLNNALAKELGDAVGMPWTPGYQYVDLYVNNTYMGTYQLTDRVKVEAGRSLVTGGNKDNDWHVQFNDNGEIKENDNSTYIAATETTPNIVIKNPDADDITAAQLATLKADMQNYFLNNFFVDIKNNVDREQLINWYICQEILCSYKGLSSIEVYRSITPTAADQKLHFGPLWDSEKAFGNASKHPIDMSDKDTEGSHEGLITKYADYGVMKKILKSLWKETWFKEGVLAKWKTLYGTEKTTDLLNILKSKATEISGTLAESQAKNAELWPTSLDYATTEKYSSYTEAVNHVKDYLDKRFAYLDVKFAELSRCSIIDLIRLIDDLNNEQQDADINDIETIKNKILNN